MPTKQPNQKSASPGDIYLARISAIQWNPTEYSADAWRAIVKAQEIACMCKEALITPLLSMDWKIAPRDPDQMDELKATIKYYTKLIERTGYGGTDDFTNHIELIAGDILDTPFGGASEIGRKGGGRDGRVAWIQPIDAATLYPTIDLEYPVVQQYMNEVVYFPKENIARAYLSPDPRILRRGWGMPPPEKVFRALQMLTMGDKYYANLLLDVPTAGILDLGDMEKSSAEEWVQAFKSLMTPGSIDSFKVPVLYEHQNPVNFISFGKVPNDIMFDRITTRYAAIVCASYGMTVGDIGLSTPSGETLAGTIRQERRTKKTGFARLKKKLKFYFDQILPEDLEFVWIDFDDETNVAVGRARLANATAFGQLIDKGIFAPQELRSQAIQEGLITVPVPEKIPKNLMPKLPNQNPQNQTSPNGKTPERPGALGSTNIPASQGGEGEITSGKSMMPNYVGLVAEHIVDELPNETIVISVPLIAESFGLQYDGSAEIYEFANNVVKSIVDELGNIDFEGETRDNIIEKVETILSNIHIEE